MCELSYKRCVSVLILYSCMFYNNWQNVQYLNYYSHMTCRERAYAADLAKISERGKLNVYSNNIGII